MITVKDITTHLESIAPLSLQENYDNAGLLTGNGNQQVTGVLVTLDCTENIVDEAIAKGCNLIVAHHPIIFSGLKKLNGKNYVERTVIKAIKNDIAIYAIHTNLDNVFNGVNQKIAQQIGLSDLQILSPQKGNLKKLVTFVPSSHLEAVQSALFNAGCGHIGAYRECSFASEGKGTFKASASTTPFVGKIGERHQEAESRLETIFPSYCQSAVLNALLKAHPYEEVAYDIYLIEVANPKIGAGMVGLLPQPMPPNDFLKHLKNSMKLNVIRFTEVNKPIHKVAVCGGAGSFLIRDAKYSGADAYVTSDVKYHEFFDAENELMIADIGHYESEIFTKELLRDVILEKFPTFAVLLSEINTNPINYYHS